MDANKYTRLDTAAESAHGLVLSLVPRGGRVLEFGCATGYMSMVLKAQLDCDVTGVELSLDAGELARKHCDRLVIGDAETLDFREVFGDDRFDTIIFADVLEHLRDPASVLRRIQPFLADGGAVIASIPNIAHGSVRLALLGGEFRYRDTGLLDSTHLRFFTRASIQDIFEATGYMVTHWLRRRAGIDETEISVPTRPLPENIREWLASDSEVTTYQFIVRAVRADVAVTLHQMRSELASVTAELAQSQRVHEASKEVAAAIPPDQKFILVDHQELDHEITSGRSGIPFLERDGLYFGLPEDDEAAIRELSRLREAGATFIVFAWPAFWWLDHYRQFQRHLRAKFRCVLENDRLVVFDMRGSAGMEGGLLKVTGSAE